jgi:hypothetical protein
MSMRERKLPGKPRPRTEVLAEFQAQRAKGRPERRVLWDLLVSPPEEVFRWRAQLDCGCIHERLSRRDQTHPSEWQEHDVVTQRRLPKGQMSCRHYDDVWSEYREIASWGDAPQVREFEPDPIEPRTGIGPDTWAKIRRDEPHKAAFWPVELSCGHPADVVMSDLNWKPGDPPRLVSHERAAEMLAKFDEDPTTFDEPRHPESREHMRRMIELRWPSPQPEQDCRICPHARTIVAFERVGWLVPPPEPESKKRGQSKVTLQRRLQDAEREAVRIGKQLAALDESEG